MNGPPCATCGQPLRWFPDHNGWGCDRCRSFIAQPPVAAPAITAPAAPRKSNKALWLGLGGAVVVGGVIAIVVVATRGGGGGGGSGSRDGVVKATVAALGAGDLDALMKLGDPEVMFDKLIECKRDDDKDPGLQAEKMREEHGELVAKTKGLTFEIVEISDSEHKAESIEKGQQLGPGCTARTAMIGHNVDVKVKYRKGDEPPVETTMELELIEAGGSWYIVDDIELELASSVIADLEKLKRQMCACKDTACGDQTTKDFESWAKSVSDDKPSERDTKILTELVGEMMTCQQKLGGAEAAADHQATVQMMSSFRDRMCACKDKPCVDAVQQEYTNWAIESAKKPTTGQPDEATTKQLVAVAEALGKCMSDVLIADATRSAGSGAPPVPPTTEPAAPAFAVGERVMARWTNGKWYPGKIVKIHADGSIDVNYDDGDKSRGLPPAKVRKKEKRSSSRSGRSSSSSDSDAPCPGPGITRRCNGKCVNIQEDNNHCGGCNNRCPDGKTCDGHLFCRDAAGNL